MEFLIGLSHLYEERVFKQTGTCCPPTSSFLVHQDIAEQQHSTGIHNPFHHHYLLHTVILTQFLQVVFGFTLFHGNLRNVINSFLFCTLVPTMAASVCDQWLQPLRKKIKHSKLRWAYSIAQTSSLTVLFVIQQ